MKRILTLTAIALGLTGGVAMADRGGRVRDHRDRDRIVVRDRGNSNWNYNRGYNRGYDGGYNRGYNRPVVRVTRTRPAFRDGRFYFGNNGGYRVYQRPVINVRYRDYYRRPALVVENYDPVPGYIWIQGNWQWNGYEWIWMNGRYEVDQNYNDSYYSNDGYSNSGYPSNGYPNSGYPNGGVYVNGSVGF